MGWVGFQLNPLETDPSRAEPVWMVTLNGAFALPACRPDVYQRSSVAAPNLPPCYWQDNGLTAVLDQFTGQLIEWQN